MNTSQNKKVTWVEWKWTHGDKYEKSARRVSQNQQMYQMQHPETEQIAFQQALLSENDVWSLEEQQIFVKEQEKPYNKREDTYNKMAEREMVGQIGMNPFMQRNYLEDVMVQENFLKPISTSLEREKFKDDSC
jgi:hypothetical protein